MLSTNETRHPASRRGGCIGGGGGGGRHDDIIFSRSHCEVFFPSEKEMTPYFFWFLPGKRSDDNDKATTEHRKQDKKQVETR